MVCNEKQDIRFTGIEPDLRFSTEYSSGYHATAPILVQVSSQQCYDISGKMFLCTDLSEQKFVLDKSGNYH